MLETLQMFYIDSLLSITVVSWEMITHFNPYFISEEMRDRKTMG